MIELQRFSINENLAKTNRKFWSFTDYEEGFYTSLYESQVLDVQNTVNKILENVSEDKKEKIINMGNRFSKLLAAYYNKDIAIQGMCPSVLISGAGNFPVRKKEKQNQAHDRNVHFYYEKIVPLKNKIENIDTVSIRSDDEHAVEILEKELSELKEKIALYKEKKVYYGSLYAKSKRIEQRIEQIKKSKDVISIDFQCDNFRIEDNKQDMRIRFFFDGKPSQEVIAACKKRGFKWSPKNLAWQRQTTINALYAAKMLKNELLNMF